MNRGALAALALLMMALPALGAQDTTTARRGASLKSDSVARASTPAPPPGSALEALVAQESQRRANIARELLVTNPQVPPQQQSLKLLSDQLYGDQVLVSSTRDQLRQALTAARKQQSSTLVVLFAADSATAAALTGVALSIDGANTNTVTYSDTTRLALRIGAADELFRGAVLPAAHSIGLTTMVNGHPQQLVARVQAVGDAVTYVQFAVQDGRLVQTAWASRGTNPF